MVFNVTGFGRFHGVESNPTSELVKYLPAFLAERHPPVGSVRFDSFTTIETSGVGALTALHDLALSTAPTRSQDERVVWLHLGVAAQQEGFKLEECAVNEATFRCPDERGWAPIEQPILPQYPTAHVLHPLFSLHEVQERMTRGKARVEVSQDCGKFVCNWLYFHSLHRCQQQIDISGQKHYAVFCHVPPFETIPLSEQLDFVGELIDVLAAFASRDCQTETHSSTSSTAP